MSKVESLIKEYLKAKLSWENIEKTSDCFNEEALLNYMSQSLSPDEGVNIEKHISNCGFCLSQLDIALKAKSQDLDEEFGKVPSNFVDKANAALGLNGKKKKVPSWIFLVTASIALLLSFFISRYFMQFLAITLIAGIRWALDSEGGRTLIMVIDSWRHHSHDKDQEISRRLKNRF